MKESFDEISKDKEKRIMKFIVEEKEEMKISIDERNRVLNKTREVMGTSKKERLTQDEEEILKEIASVVYTAYKKHIEILDKKERGGMENEPTL